MIQYMRPLAMSLSVQHAIGVGLLSVCVLRPMTGCGTPPQGQADVKLGEQADGKVEILSGLKPGERYIARSDKPVKDGEAVRLSILSEK